jgi:hypothetical protein
MFRIFAKKKEKKHLYNRKASVRHFGNPQVLRLVDLLQLQPRQPALLLLLRHLVVVLHSIACRR